MADPAFSAEPATSEPQLAEPYVCSPLFFQLCPFSRRLPPSSQPNGVVVQRAQAAGLLQAPHRKSHAAEAMPALVTG